MPATVDQKSDNGRRMLAFDGSGNFFLDHLANEMVINKFLVMLQAVHITFCKSHLRGVQFTCALNLALMAPICFVSQSSIACPLKRIRFFNRPNKYKHRDIKISRGFGINFKQMQQ